MTDFLKARWENIVMANYAVPQAVLAPYLPAGCELDLYQGSAYVSLVGFMFKHTRLFQIPIPVLGTFEEINLRFYVVRKEQGQVKRGVVFINETIPYQVVAWVANKLYKEHYTSIPTKHVISQHLTGKHIEYRWKVNRRWNSMVVEASTSTAEMMPASFEEFIFEHYYGYTKIGRVKTEEYKINHPRWNIHQVQDYKIDCDFGAMYGHEFSFLNTVKLDAVFMAEGSAVSVKWKRRQLELATE